MLFNVGTVGSLSDGQLLERFATGVGEARELAFAALVERHGPLVYRVCRAVLGDEHEADDAFRPRSSRSPTRPKRSGRATLSAPGSIRLPIGRRATIDHPG
jgi:Sigma-70 region 2